MTIPPFDLIHGIVRLIGGIAEIASRPSEIPHANTALAKYKIVFAQGEQIWRKAELFDNPVMQVKSEWWMSETTGEDLYILQAELWFWHRCRRKIAHQMSMIDRGKSGTMRRLCLEFTLAPPICRNDENFKAQVVVIDNLEGRHNLGKVLITGPNSPPDPSWRSHGIGLRPEKTTSPSATDPGAALGEREPTGPLMHSERQPFLEELSPDGRAVVEIQSPSRQSQAFYAKLLLNKNELNCFPFGYYAPPTSLSLRWDLPDTTVGFYLDGRCYALFRYGARRRRRRESYRVGQEHAFTPKEIDWIVAKDHGGSIRCPSCRAFVRQTALICRYCGKILDRFLFSTVKWRSLSGPERKAFDAGYRSCQELSRTSGETRPLKANYRPPVGYENAFRAGWKKAAEKALAKGDRRRGRRAGLRYLVTGLIGLFVFVILSFILPQGALPFLDDHVLGLLGLSLLGIALGITMLLTGLSDL